jgi:hypothetical protein
MDTIGNRQELKAPKNERLTSDEAPIVAQVINEGDVSLRAMWTQLMRLMPQLNPEYEQPQVTQPDDTAQRYQFAPAVGASAVQAQPGYETTPVTPQHAQNAAEQAHFEAWEQQVNSDNTIDLTAQEQPYQPPQYLDDAVNDAVAEAEGIN